MPIKVCLNSISEERIKVVIWVVVHESFGENGGIAVISLKAAASEDEVQN